MTYDLHANFTHIRLESVIVPIKSAAFVGIGYVLRPLVMYRGWKAKSLSTIVLGGAVHSAALSITGIIVQNCLQTPPIEYHALREKVNRFDLFSRGEYMLTNN